MVEYMSKLYVIGDLHLGHNNIIKYSPNRGGSNVEEHDEWIIEQWNSVVKPCDVTIVLGDVAFNKEGLSKMSRLRGNKHLIFGNHDKFSLNEYLKYFGKVHGFYKKKGVWLSHAPIHPMSLRDLKNVHGHMHNHTVNDDRYICVSVEQLNGIPVELEKII